MQVSMFGVSRVREGATLEIMPVTNPIQASVPEHVTDDGHEPTVMSGQ